VFELDSRFFETIFGSRPQPPSDLVLKTNRNEVFLKANIFGGKIQVNASAQEKGEIPLEVDLDRFNVLTFSSIFDQSGLDWPLTGEGICKIKFSSDLSRSSAIKKLAIGMQQANCGIAFQASRILRGSSMIHR